MKKQLYVLFTALAGGLAAEHLPALPGHWIWEISNKDYAVEQHTERNTPFFKIFGPVTLKSGKTYPVDPQNRYRFSFELRGYGYSSAPGFECLDKDGKPILPAHVNYMEETDTVLDADCGRGDRIIRIKPAKNMWKKSSYAVVAFDTKDDLKDLPNRNVTAPGIREVRKCGAYWEVTLSNPCPFAYPAGKKVRLHSALDKTVRGAVASSPAWIRETVETSQNFDPEKPAMLYPGTRYIRLLIHANTNGPNKGYVSEFRNFSFEKCEFVMKKISNSPVAENFPYLRYSPNSIIKMKNGEIQISFSDNVDIAASSATYTAVSKDGGKTWEKAELRFKDKNPLVGTSGQMLSLPDGRLLLAETRAWCKDFARDARDQLKRNLRTYLRMDLHVSDDGGKTFRFLQSAGSGRYGVITSSSSKVVVLANGDWILPGYAYQPLDNKKSPTGCGFFRSTDKGKTWGDLEPAFPNPPGKKVHRFNEVAFAVKPDGKLVAIARTDSGPLKYRYLHKAVSADNGKTWSKPVPTGINGIFPDIIKLDNGIYVLVCGVRDVPGHPQQPRIFLSRDGERFQDMGSVYFSRPKSWHGKQDPRYWGTGSAQCLEKASANSFYVAFEGADQALIDPADPRTRRYIDFNHFEVDFAK